jgi:hypothetical protein
MSSRPLFQAVNSGAAVLVDPRTLTRGLRAVLPSVFAAGPLRDLAAGPAFYFDVHDGTVLTDAIRWAGLPAVGTVTDTEGTPCDASLTPLPRFVVWLWADNDSPGQRHIGIDDFHGASTMNNRGHGSPEVVDEQR